MQLQWLLDRGYRVCSRADFEHSCSVTGLIDRAKPYIGSYVVYDPDDDVEGFMLIGNEPNQLCVKAWEHLETQLAD